MVSPIKMHVKTSKRGIYETFDFRGLSADGRYAFTLKHTVFKPWLGHGSITVAMICFDHKTTKIQSFYEQEALSVTQQIQLNHADHWENCTFGFATGSFFEISRDVLRGKLHTHQGSMSWHLNVQRHDEVLEQFPQTVCYHLPWPRHKIQIRDCFLRYYGKIQCAGLSLSGEFSGSNHHYWGDGYPVEYAAAQCNHFVEDTGAFFYGFSARLSVSKLFTTPYLSMASLKLHGCWYHFNQVWQSFQHHVEALDNYRWRITFLNADYGLNVDIEGRNPRMQAWVGWHAERALGGRSVIKMTPFAVGAVTLYRRGSMELITELTTHDMELKTLLPENHPESSDFWIAP